MREFEYEVTKHEAEEFSQIIIFCSGEGDCSLNDISDSQTKQLAHLLNERGKRGWELVQVAFGRGGILALWKRAMGG